MMFLIYAVPGAFAPLYSLCLESNCFTPEQIGIAAASQALAALVGPLLVGQVVDRWWPAEHCLTVCSLLACLVLWVLADLTLPATVSGFSLLAWLFITPTMTLSTVISFAHLRTATHGFGRV